MSENRENFFLEVLKAKIWLVEPDTGRVLNTKTKKYMGETKGVDPNSVFSYMQDRIVFSISRYRLLWLFSYGLIGDDYAVRLKDRSKPASKDNLEKLLKSEIAKEAGKLSTNYRQGSRNNFSKFADEEVLDLRREYTRKPFSIRKRAAELSTNHITLSKLLQGATYSYLPEACTVLSRGQNGSSEENKQAKFQVKKEKINERNRRRYERNRTRNKNKKERPLSKTALALQQAVSLKIPVPIVKEKKPAKPPVVKAPRINLEKFVPKEQLEQNKKDKEAEKLMSPEERKKKIERIRLDKERIKLEREKAKFDKEQAKLNREIEIAKQEKLRSDRLNKIKQAAQQVDIRNGKVSPPLFKMFAVYHLYKVLKETKEITMATAMATEDEFNYSIEKFLDCHYQDNRKKLIEKHGRDSALLAKIRMFEGDFES